MHRHAFILLCAAALATGCSSSSDGGDPATTPLDIAVSAGDGAVPAVTDGVKADGATLVIITVNGATAAPIRVTASRGTFPNGATTAMIADTTGSVELQVCDARTDNLCVGTLTITAFDGKQGYGQKKLTLVGFETSCTNNKDDNGDRRSDCGDPDCDSEACVGSGGAAGTCQSGLCTLPTCTPTGDTEICTNATDDDCDRKTDCAQTSCDGQPCRAGSPTFVCRAGACTDAGTGMALTVTPRRTRLPADGKAQTLVTVKVTKTGTAQAGAVVDVATNLGAFVVGSETPTETSVTTAADGTAQVTYQAAATDGAARITATLRDNATVSETAIITLPVLGSITVGAIQNQVMGVKFSGWNEQNQLSVQLLDSEQKPYPDGLAVRFEHQQLGASAISTPYAPDTASCIKANGCLAFVSQTASPQDKPDTTGLAPLTMYSGTAAGPVAVNVTATAGGVTRNLQVQNIAIVGAKASGKNISLFCTPQTLPAFAANDCTNSFVDMTVGCTVFLADRFNNVLGVSTRADFRSEAGSPGPPTLTKAYDPVKGGDQTADLGKATNSVAVMGYRLPRDVPPVPGEFNAVADVGCGNATHNPRDGLSTVMAAVQGEEGFVDLNGNGVYEVGEPFIDAGEPFVDENDNGVRDNDEPFIDVNQNGSWGAPNGVWDADTVVWAEARVVYSSRGGDTSRFYAITDDLSLPGPTPPASFRVAPKGTVTYGIWFTDQNFNPLAAGATYEVATSNDRVEAVLATPPPTPGLGMSFTQQLCDKAPPDAPTACNATCQFAPCYRVTRVGGYQYGNRGSVTINAGEETGSTSVTVKATVGGELRTIQINGAVEVPQ